jgi:hypothetical protein
LGNGVDLSIRPNSSDQVLHAYQVLDNPVKLVAFEPHLHAPGKRMCLEAIWGPHVETLTCAGYDHNWVRTYRYGDNAAPLLPAGTILHLYGEMDVSANNPNMPEIRNWTGSGNRSVSNMFLELGFRVNLTEEQFLQEMAERRQALNLGPNDYVIGCPLCTAPLVSPVQDDLGLARGWITIAHILAEMNHFPNDAQKAELLAIAEDPESSRPMQLLAEVVANIQHTVAGDDRVSMERAIQVADRFPPGVETIISGVLEFNHSVSPETKAALEAL